MTNLVIVRGVINREPDIKENMTILNVEITKRFKDNQTGDWREQKTWIKVKKFGVMSFVPAILNSVMVIGEIATSSWDKGDGTKGYETYIKANDVSVVMTTPDNSHATQRPQEMAPPPQKLAGFSLSAPAQTDQVFGMDFDDSIPF